jgi:hypothetical protein
MKRLTKGGAAMRKIVIVALAVADLVLMPLAGYPQSDQETSAAAPPVAQPLVREGSFAVSLAKSLDMGAPQNEADAESLLASVGIAPKNGWIADYPVTPDVLGDLQEAVAAASDSGRLPMGKDEALKSLRAVADEFGLPVVAPSSGSYTQNNGPPPPYNEENPMAIDNYYYTYGPPVVTYYLPPPDYEYLYAWVPYPFWFGGFFFTGYFCLHDFDRIIFINHANRVCTNHVLDRRTGTIALIDPAGRRVEGSLSHGSGFASPEARRGAGAIFNRSFERGKARVAESGHVSRGFMSVNPVPSRPGEHFQSQVPSERHYGTQGMRMGRREEGDGFAGSGERVFSSPPSGFARSFRAQPAPERAPSMRFPRSGAGNFSRGASFGGFTAEVSARGVPADVRSGVSRAAGDLSVRGEGLDTVSNHSGAVHR